MKPNGVDHYVIGSVDIAFEPDHVSCSFCPLLETYSRNQCRRTGEYIVDVKHSTGAWCPLEFRKSEEV